MTLAATIPPPAPAPAYGWTRNGAAQISGNDLLLTQPQGGSAGSAFYNTPVATANLQIAFTTLMAGGTGGTGIAVVLADPTQASPLDVGAPGPGYGFTGIPGTAITISTTPGTTAGTTTSAVSLATSTLGATGAPTFVTTNLAAPNLRLGTHDWFIKIGGGAIAVTCDGEVLINQAVNLTATALLGFTAANGTQDDYHTVRNVTVSSTPARTTSGTPWVFDITNYGAVGDGQVVTDGAITSGSTRLTCATSRPFAQGDVNKAVMVLHAAATGITTLATTIAAYIDPAHVTLAAAAGATVASGGIVMWATDDTVAIQAAINAGNTFATAFTPPQVGVQPRYAVFTPPGSGSFYGVDGPLVQSALGNGQLTIPVVPETSQGVTCEIVGVESGAKTRYWNQAVPAMTASTWVSFGLFGSLNAQNASANNGRPAMISGPSGANGYGVSAVPLPKYSNLTLHIKNMSLLTAHSAYGFTYDAVNAHGCARLILEDMSWGTTGTVPGGDYGAPAGFANGNSVGITMPGNGNNAMNSVSRSICQGGYTFDIFATEHTVFDANCILLYGWVGLGLVGTFGDGGTGVGALHAVKAPQLCIEGCSYQVSFIGPGSAGFGPTFHGCLDTEGANAFRETNTGGPDGLASSSALGEIRLTGANNTISTTYPTSMRIINDMQAPGPVATPSYTLGTAQINTFWRPATVLLSGGTVTAVKVSALMGGQTAPAMTTVWSGALTAPITIHIPPGAWWEIDGTVKPTAAWMLH